MVKPHEEWLKQADYDMETADCMFQNGRYLYAVFMCHLSVEKALKGLYQFTIGKVPPKTHNLVGLVDRINISPPEGIARFLVRLNDSHITTRYPEKLAAVQAIYTEPVTRGFLDGGKGTLEWIRTQF